MEKLRTDLLDSIYKMHRKLGSFSEELNRQSPRHDVRFDLSMFPKDQAKWAGAPMGILWEMNFDASADEEIFFFEFIN